MAGALGAEIHGADLAQFATWTRGRRRRRDRSAARGQRPLGPYCRCRPAIPIVALTEPMPIPIAVRGDPSGTRSVSWNSDGDLLGRA